MSEPLVHTPFARRLGNCLCGVCGAAHFAYVDRSIAIGLSSLAEDRLLHRLSREQEESGDISNTLGRSDRRIPVLSDLERRSKHEQNIRL